MFHKEEYKIQFIRELGFLQLDSLKYRQMCRSKSVVEFKKDFPIVPKGENKKSLRMKSQKSSSPENINQTGGLRHPHPMNLASKWIIPYGFTLGPSWNGSIEKTPRWLILVAIGGGGHRARYER